MTLTKTMAVEVLPATSVALKFTDVPVALSGYVAGRTGSTRATPEPTSPLVSAGSIASASAAGAVGLTAAPVGPVASSVSAFPTNVGGCMSTLTAVSASTFDVFVVDNPESLVTVTV